MMTLRIPSSEPTSLEPSPYIDRPFLHEVAKAIRASTRVLITCHVNPDGDALGSLIGLGTALKDTGKSVVMVSADGVPFNLSFLPGSDSVVTTAGDSKFDLAIVVDAGDLGRVGATRAAVEASAVVIDIDHHVSSGVFGDFRLVDSGAAATAEIIFDLLGALEIPLSPAIAECLLCGLLTDTGSFRFMNVTQRTMTVAGFLIGLGASPNRIAENVFENKSFASLKVLGRALTSMGISEDGRLVWASVSGADLSEFDATDEDTGGIVNAIQTVRDSEVAMFLREMADGQIRVSLRTRPPYDVSVVAAKFGGGGHRLASGCTVAGPLAAAQGLLILAMTAELSKAGIYD